MRCGEALSSVSPTEVAPAVDRRHRQVERLLKSLVKTLSQNVKGKVKGREASATGESARMP